MAHPLLIEAKRQAEKLNRYCIRHHKSCAILWRYGDGWSIAAVFPSDEAAENYLMTKLPAPEG
jgi:hypothetical protein